MKIGSTFDVCGLLLVGIGGEYLKLMTGRRVRPVREPAMEGTIATG